MPAGTSPRSDRAGYFLFCRAGRWGMLPWPLRLLPWVFRREADGMACITGRSPCLRIFVGSFLHGMQGIEACPACPFRWYMEGVGADRNAAWGWTGSRSVFLHGRCCEGAAMPSLTDREARQAARHGAWPIDTFWIAAAAFGQGCKRSGNPWANAASPGAGIPRGYPLGLPVSSLPASDDRLLREDRQGSVFSAACPCRFPQAWHDRGITKACWNGLQVPGGI